MRWTPLGGETRRSEWDVCGPDSVVPVLLEGLSPILRAGGGIPHDEHAAGPLVHVAALDRKQRKRQRLLGF